MASVQGPVLMPIDVQMGFDYPPWLNRSPASMEQNGIALLSHWRAQGWPVVHVRHASRHAASPLHESHPGHAFRPGFEPQVGETVIKKDVNSAFIGTDLERRLNDMGKPPLVMFGVSGDMCVSTTARMAANLGFGVTVVEDACWCFDLPGRDGALIPAQTIHAAHMATLRFEFCKVETASVLIEALGTNRA
jgi:nicotinamidase-related amidase